MFDLKGKKALITGSTQGIGLATARILSAHGAVVYINGADDKDVIKSVSDSIPNSQPAPVDLLDVHCADKLYELTGDVDILILSASVQYPRSWNEVVDEEIDKQFIINFKSSLKLVQRYAPAMIAQKWGRIVTIGSVQQIVQSKKMITYAALKSAYVNLAENLARQFGPYGITVNNVAPGIIKTPRNDETLSNKAVAENLLKDIPAGYFGEAEDVAPQILLLCSDEGRYINGANIFVDGGMKL